MVVLIDFSFSLTYVSKIGFQVAQLWYHGNTNYEFSYFDIEKQLTGNMFLA